MLAHKRGDNYLYSKKCRYPVYDTIEICQGREATLVDLTGMLKYRVCVATRIVTPLIDCNVFG